MDVYYSVEVGMLLNTTTESSWYAFATTELPRLPLEERYRRAERKLASMSKEERRELARACSGMWVDK